MALHADAEPRLPGAGGHPRPADGGLFRDRRTQRPAVRADDPRPPPPAPPLLLIKYIHSQERTPRTKFFFSPTPTPPRGGACGFGAAAPPPPASMNGLEGRLCSRFQWGLVAD